MWLESTNLTPENITTIAHALKQCTDISVLSLRENNVCQAVAGVLLEALMNNCKLRLLYLGNNQLEDRGVTKLSEALNTTHGLLILDLIHNNISEAAADALAAVITSCRN